MFTWEIVNFLTKQSNPSVNEALSRSEKFLSDLDGQVRGSSLLVLHQSIQN